MILGTKQVPFLIDLATDNIDAVAWEQSAILRYLMSLNRLGPSLLWEAIPPLQAMA